MKHRQKGNTKIFLLIGVLVLVGGAVMLMSDGMQPDPEGAKGTVRVPLNVTVRRRSAVMMWSWATSPLRCSCRPTSLNA